MSLLLLLALALAEDSAQDALPAEDAPPAETAPDTDDAPRAEHEPAEDEIPEPPPLAEAATAELMDEALRRIRLADYTGARLLLDEVQPRPDADLEEITYLRGVSYELDRDYATALSLYTEGLAQFPGGHRAEDFAFRSAEVVGGLGRPEEALERLEPFLDDLDTRPHADQIKIRLVEGIWLAEVGKEKQALRRIAAALDEAEAGEVSFYQAKARAAVAAVWAAEAAELTLDVRRERKQVRRLTKRGELLVAIERQVTQVALLKEPEWVLAGLLTLGGAYQAVGEDLRATRPPRKLAPELHALYAQTVAEKSDVVLVKALKHYEKGIELALELGWRSRRVGELRARRDALAAELEAPLEALPAEVEPAGE